MKQTLRNSGFTLQEVLVALVVSSIILGLSYQLYLGTLKVFNHWTNVDGERIEKLLIRQQLSWDLERSSTVSLGTDSSLTLILTNGRKIVYQAKNRNLFRNGDKIGSPEIQSISVRTNLGVGEEVIVSDTNGRTILRHIFVPAARHKFLSSRKTD